MIRVFTQPEPRTGGVIISAITDRKTLERELTRDPFYRENIASYEITEVIPTKAANELKFLIG
ncbi:hypothetical protein [Pseudoalteromonas sp. P1-9]|uniref:hypothetical protein n=1 Tax=Pseudoalteromonas sp. P1-9 TaxID=1710354 RepID=UPI000AA5D4AF|nr:hypothetical protein [Pseudoalteromonas sp. P1-9]